MRAEIKVMLKNSHETVISLAQEYESACLITAASFEIIIFGVEKKEKKEVISERV